MSTESLPKPSSGLRGLDDIIMSTPAPRKSVDSLPSPLFSPTTPTRNIEYPFPRYDASLRPGSSGRFPSRRGSTASATNSIGGTLDTTNSNWTHSVRESGQNAISTLLQPPIVRTGHLPHTSAPASSAHKPPTSRDIPPVSLTNIAHVETAAFRPYLSQVGALYDALQRAKDAEDEELPRLLRRKSSKVDDFADLLSSPGKGSSRTPDISRKASLASLASLTPESPNLRRRSSAGLGRRAPQAPTPLSTIPNVYFDDDFHLENPRTFDVVSERSEVVRPVLGSHEERKGSNGSILAPRKALATNAILQEKLSWYMDTIEIHLIGSISTASSSFFAALGSLRELHSEASESVERIKALRRELQALDQEMALGGRDIVNLRRKRENLKQLSSAVQQLKCIVEGVGICESLVDSGRVERALDAMDALESLIAGEQSEMEAELLNMTKQKHLRDLSGATALQGVNNDLDTLRYKIGRVFETRFLNALLGDLRKHIEAVAVKDTLQRWSNASQRSRGGHNREPSVFPTYMNLNNEFRAELLANLNGLHRAKHTSPATSAYREAVLREVKTIIKRPLPSSNDDDNDSMMSASTVGGRQLSQQERSSILARNLRALEPGAAEETLVKIYIGVGESLRRLGTQVKVLLDVTSTLGDPSGPMSPMSPPRSPNVAVIDARMNGSDNSAKSSARQIQEEMHQALDMSNLLGQAVDIAQNQIVKVLRVRSEQSVGQTLTRFLRYFTLNLLFANECEAVSGRGGTALKTVVNGQIKDFVKQFGEPCQRKLADAMDSDVWNAKDFTEQDTAVLNRVLEGSDRDPEPWTVGGKVWLPYEEPLPETSNGTTATANGTTKEKVRQATIESESFMLPASAIVCLQGLEPFLQLITGIPSMTSDVAPHIVSYLQVFNSKCTQLILGAGATRSVGLKNITTKHLALASQALSFISTLIPHIREFVRRHAGSGPAVSTLMGDFDKVRRAYQEHQNSISEKLVDIMSGRANTHVKAMKNINWDDGKETGVSPYMDTLVKETTTLHKVLSRHLPDMTVLMIMEPVFKSYKDQWGKAYGDVVLETKEGHHRMLRDVESFASRMSKIDGSGDVGAFLVKLVGDKKVVKPVPPLPLPPTPAAETPEKNEDVVLNGNAEVDKAVEVVVPESPPEKAEDVVLKDDTAEAKKEES